MVPACPSIAARFSDSALKEIPPSASNAIPRSVRSRVSRSSAGNTRPTACAYCHTCVQLPGQAPVPSHAQNLPELKRWQVVVANVETFRKVLSKNHHGKEESYQVCLNNFVWVDSFAKFSFT